MYIVLKIYTVYKYLLFDECIFTLMKIAIGVYFVFVFKMSYEHILYIDYLHDFLHNLFLYFKYFVFILKI